METVLSFLSAHVFLPQLSNGANKKRHQATIHFVAKAFKNSTYDIYIDWESSTRQHYRLMAVHKTFRTTVRIHIMVEGRIKVVAEGPKFLKKYDLVHHIAKLLCKPPRKTWTVIASKSGVRA